MRKKRILVTSTDLMMVQFLLPHIKNLAEHGYSVGIACSEVGGRMKEVREALQGTAACIHQVRLHRNPADPENLLGLKDMCQILNASSYDIIWTNEPVMGVMTRLAAAKARRNGTIVVYMVHGFHFFKGAPFLYWMSFYPVETVMSFFADVIVTMNKEDRKRAQRMHARQVRYLHGIGVNTARLTESPVPVDIRLEAGMPEDSFMVLSVGELNENKNHQAVIRAIGLTGDPQIHYCICGKGDLQEKLKALAAGLGLEDRIHLLGYRTDIVDIYRQADVFCLPSRREGLSLSAMEAMYCGLPLIQSDRRDSRDYMGNGKAGFLVKADDVQGYAEAIRRLKEDPELRRRMGSRNRRAVRPYCLENVKQEVLDLFDSLRERKDIQ